MDGKDADERNFDDLNLISKPVSAVNMVHDMWQKKYRQTAKGNLSMRSLPTWQYQQKCVSLKCGML